MEEEGPIKPEEEGVWLQNLGEETVGFLKHLNAVLFPVHYHQKYYSQALSSGPFSKLGTHVWDRSHVVLRGLLVGDASTF